MSGDAAARSVHRDEQRRAEFRDIADGLRAFVDALRAAGFDEAPATEIAVEYELARAAIPETVVWILWRSAGDGSAEILGAFADVEEAIAAAADLEGEEELPEFATAEDGSLSFGTFLYEYRLRPFVVV